MIQKSLVGGVIVVLFMQHVSMRCFIHHARQNMADEGRYAVNDYYKFCSVRYIYNYDDDCEFVNDFLVKCFFLCNLSGSLSWTLVGCRM